MSHNYAIVDDADYSAVSKHKWFMIAKSYAGTRIAGQLVYMHQFIMGGAPEYDHKNGFELDNRRCNLRPATHKQNTQNCRKRKFHGKPDQVTTSKYKGVSWRKDRQRWQAYIGSPTAGAGRQSLGCYATEEEAAAAYNKAAIVRFGEFAKLNDIQS